MANFELMRRLTEDKGGKILLLVMDGLGGLPMTPAGLTELEAADTPNLDRLAKEGSTGLTIPVARGDRAGERSRTSGAVRLRSAGLRHRARRAGSDWHRAGSRTRRRGGARQFLHHRRAMG